ncbi:MAG: 30S ribosomal protein S20 [Acidobacteriota bacterium]
MASHASALKAHRQNVERRERNRQLRSRLRNALRATREAMDHGDDKTAQDQLKVTASLIDRMVAKGVVHKNAASRYKSRLHARVGRATKAA